jgi:hypothetical protein
MMYGTDAPRNILYVFVFSLMIGLRHGLHISSPRLDMMFALNNPMRRFLGIFIAQTSPPFTILSSLVFNDEYYSSY